MEPIRTMEWKYFKRLTTIAGLVLVLFGIASYFTASAIFQGKAEEALGSLKDTTAAHGAVLDSVVVKQAALEVKQGALEKGQEDIAAELGHLHVAQDTLTSRLNAHCVGSVRLVTRLEAAVIALEAKLE